MGLDTSHDCWHGAYTAFMRLRAEILAAVNPNFDPDNYYKAPFKEDGSHYQPYLDGANAVADPALREFLLHSDCDGTIEREWQIPMAEALEVAADIMESRGVGLGVGHIEYRGGYVECTRQFARGLRSAYEANEAVEFH